MNQPQEYRCPLHPRQPCRLSQSPGFGCPASHMKLALVICFTYGNVYVSMLFSQIIPPSPSPTEFPKPWFSPSCHSCQHSSSYCSNVPENRQLQNSVPSCIAKLAKLWYQCLRHMGVFHDCIDRILSDKILSRLVLSSTHGLFTPKGDWDDENGQVSEQRHLLSSWRLLTAAALDTGRGGPRNQDLKSDWNHGLMSQVRKQACADKGLCCCKGKFIEVPKGWVWALWVHDHSLAMCEGRTSPPCLWTHRNSVEGAYESSMNHLPSLFCKTVWETGQPGTRCPHTTSAWEVSPFQVWEAIAVTVNNVNTHLNTNLALTVVLPVVIYGCESWTIKKAEHQRTDDFKLWC